MKTSIVARFLSGMAASVVAIVVYVNLVKPTACLP